MAIAKNKDKSEDRLSIEEKLLLYQKEQEKA